MCGREGDIYSTKQVPQISSPLAAGAEFATGQGPHLNCLAAETRTAAIYVGLLDCTAVQFATALQTKLRFAKPPSCFCLPAPGCVTVMIICKVLLQGHLSTTDQPAKSRKQTFIKMYVFTLPNTIQLSIASTVGMLRCCMR